MQKFSAQDAQSMLEIAQTAPLQNFHAAKAMDALFSRYTLFMQEVFAPPKPPNEQVAAGVAEALAAAAKPNGNANGEPAPAESMG